MLTFKLSDETEFRCSVCQNPIASVGNGRIVVVGLPNSGRLGIRPSLWEHVLMATKRTKADKAQRRADRTDSFARCTLGVLVSAVLPSDQRLSFHGKLEVRQAINAVTGTRRFGLWHFPSQGCF